MFSVLQEFSNKVNGFKDAVQNESQTRTVLIEPFIKLLGYDTTNPFEVVPEYVCDVGTKKGEKVDYALMKNNDIVMLIEAKDCKVKLSDKSIGQLFRYYSVSSARVALLTNGLDYWFFTDTIKKNVMDQVPFYKFNILEVTEKDSEVIKLFLKDVIDTESIRSHAMTSIFTNAFINYFIQQSKSPTNDFISFMTKNIGLTNINSRDAVNLVSSSLHVLLEGKYDNGVVKSQVINNTTEQVKSKKKKRKMPTEFPDKLVGLVTLDQFTPKNCKGTKPKELLIKDKVYSVATWSDVLASTIKYCIDIGKEHDYIVKLDETPNTKVGWIDYSGEGMRSAREVDGSGIFIDTHCSSIDAVRKIRTVCNELGVEQSEVLISLV